MRKLELHLGRRLVWLVCSLHTGELPLCHLIVVMALVCQTKNYPGHGGPIGKLLDSATDFEINPNFTRISVGPPLIKQPDKRILAIRGDGDPETQLGDSSVRTRGHLTLIVMLSASQLIRWSEDVSEPPLTCSLSTSEVPTTQWITKDRLNLVSPGNRSMIASRPSSFTEAFLANLPDDKPWDAHVGGDPSCALDKRTCAPPRFT
ncbi:hypothetical protein GWK47_009769 [Chionoecetes opilio]|uniref:Uncharacterized protein n=1 Tax=Chionoecetes opilio TaxID=41210 RepID=A0A8J4Y445_CHIOP|nr:hypothetical protein GWK47_009769 [Chionoecetes opilio]